MIFVKILFIFILNFIFIPIYFVFFILSFILSFIPIFPTLTSKENLRNQVHIQGVKANGIITLMYLNYAFYLFEAFIFDPLRLTHCTLENNLNLIETMLEMKRIYPQTKNLGFVYISPHMANVEMYSLPITQANKILGQEQVYALAKPSKIHFINKLLLWYRERPGLGIFWTDTKLIANMGLAIKKNCSIAMLVDQKPKTGGVFLKFFNQYAAFPLAGLRFCMSKNMIVLYTSGHRVIPGWVSMQIRAGKNPHLEIQNASHMEGVQTQSFTPTDMWDKENIYEKDKYAAVEMSYFVRWIENEIKKKPSQWCWDYRKWSRKPV